MVDNGRALPALGTRTSGSMKLEPGSPYAPPPRLWLVIEGRPRPMPKEPVCERAFWSAT